MMDVSEYVKDGYLKVRLKPNSDENSIEGYDEAREAVIVRICEPAQDNKANKELVKFMADELQKTVWLKSGYKSREKLLAIEE